MIQQNWTPEQWYAWARARVEAEMRWYEYERLRQEREARKLAWSSDKMTSEDQWISAKSGLMDLIVGGPLWLLSKLLGG